jgi:hypothetical protein
MMREGSTHSKEKVGLGWPWWCMSEIQTMQEVIVSRINVRGQPQATT